MTITAKEARKQFKQLVDAAERGETVTITRRGKKVARLVPAEEKGRKRLPDLSAFRASFEVKGKPLSETVIEMRREARY